MSHIERGIAYGPGARQRLDIYRSSRMPAPVLVYLYGGTWKTGRRETYGILGRSFARRGILCVVADYRLYPEVRFPAFPQEAAEIVRFVHDKAPDWGGDPDTIFVMGHSAGAHSAALLAFDAERYGAPQIKGVIALAGPLTFNPLEHDSVKAVFEGHEPIDDARPIKRVHGRAPPLLLLHGRGDKTVGVHNSENLASAVRTAGGEAELKIYPGIGHVGIIAAVAWPLRWRASVLADVVAFVRKHAGDRG
ncbi:MAG: alpha/beta hydrolase [Alphaproteobacteria bacterium]